MSNHINSLFQDLDILLNEQPDLDKNSGCFKYIKKMLRENKVPICRTSFEMSVNEMSNLGGKFTKVNDTFADLFIFHPTPI